MTINELPRHVLIVEDSEVQRQFIVDYCQEMGISNISEAENGYDALALLKCNPDIEAMVLDLEMPGMDGVQVLYELAALERTPAVAVISGQNPVMLSMVENIAVGLRLHWLGLLHKPVSKEQFLACLVRFAGLSLRNHSFERWAPELKLSKEDISRAFQHHEFVAYFQPKVQLQDGELKSVEALVRWHHPEHGMLEPRHFIGLVEQEGYIDELTLQMLDSSLQYCRLWHAAGLPLSFSLNLATTSMNNTELADAIIERVSDSGVPPSCVVLEFTESAMQNAAGDALARLRDSGFGLSVDDFGTGFYGMLQLEQAACTELKVDRAFVNGASKSKHLRTLLQSALDIAHQRRISVVAEGVENPDDWSLLQKLGCDQVQGHYIAKAMTGDTLMAWWEDNRERLHKISSGH